MKPIKLKVTRSELQDLLQLHNYVLPLYIPDDSHEELLKDHMQHLAHRLFLMAVNRHSSTFTISLSRPEARGLYQVWLQLDLDQFPAWNILILRLVADLDQVFVTLKKLTA